MFMAAVWLPATPSWKEAVVQLQWDEQRRCGTLTPR